MRENVFFRRTHPHLCEDKKKDSSLTIGSKPIDKSAAEQLLKELKKPVQGLQSLHQSLVRTCNNFAEAMNRAAAREVANSPAMRDYMPRK